MHIRNIHSGKEFKCEECDEVFKNQKNLSRHKMKHDNVTPFKTCELCGKGFQSLERLKAHIKYHSKAPLEKVFSCSECAFTTVYENSLSKHMKTVHCEEKPFECSLCHKTFKLEYLMKRHFKLIHTNEAERYPCDQCSYTTSDKRHLKTHINSVHLGLRPFSCETCQSTFTQSSHLNYHIKTVHQKGQFECRHCELKFDTNNARYDHEKVDHKGESLLKYKCDQCDFITTTNTRLKRHSFVHQDERPIMCVCGSGFVRESELKTHLKNHCKNATDFL